MATHMLYHVDPPEAGVAEARRVLRPGGIFYAATNGSNHVAEIDGLWRERWDIPFSLENGEETLRAAFGEVEFDRYPAHLEVTDAEAVVRYLDSYQPLSEQDRARIRSIVRSEITANGSFRVSIDVGLFTAW